MDNAGRRFKVKKGITGVAITLVLFFTGCRLTYLFHAASGQFRLLVDSVPIEEAIKADSLGPEEKNRLLLVARAKDFGERELGLRKTDNYQTVYLKSHQAPIYIVSASPRDRLARVTWWFPVVGDMPYLGFFDRESAESERGQLAKKGLDVTMGIAHAYSTLGWFQDPVTLNLLEGSTVTLVETILHEMTHTTIYVNGQGEFNEGLAVLVSKVGTHLFFERTFGPCHPFTVHARESIEDEQLFSAFLSLVLERLSLFYNSPLSYQEKLAKREQIFSESLVEFGRVAVNFKTSLFIHFGNEGLNNAYLMSVGLYHRHFHFFEAVLKKRGNSIKEMLGFFQGLSKEKGDILKRAAKELHLPTGRG
jgi:predicted aminopeptidase